MLFWGCFEVVLMLRLFEGCFEVVILSVVLRVVLSDVLRLFECCFEGCLSVALR